MKQVVRYQNRKLYDTEDSGYITLETLYHLVRAGEVFTVTDHRTKRDVTDKVAREMFSTYSNTTASTIFQLVRGNV